MGEVDTTAPTETATPQSPEIADSSVSKPPAIHLLAQHPADGSTKESSSTGRVIGDAPYYTSAQWSADGTSIITTSSNQTVSSFILPADLLSHVDSDRQLAPQGTIKLPEPAQAIAVAPYFSLLEPATQTILVGCRDHPLHIYQAFPKPQDDDGHDDSKAQLRAAPIASYKLIRMESEAYITPSSMLWESPGTHFLCGSANRLDYFDLSRHGSDGPLLTVPTIPSRRHISKGGGVGMKGTVSALAASPMDANDGSIIAAGTWTRWMGLYDLHHTNKVVANWSIANAESGFNIDLGGQGIVQTLWSPCGRYLIINERRSTGLLVYDIRGTGQLLSVLHGRKSNSQQKMTCDVFQSQNGGFEVWAGSQDGSVAVWEGVGNHSEIAEPSWQWIAHESPIGSTALHPSGSVVATCSGGWGPVSDSDAENTHGAIHRHVPQSKKFGESSLRVWSIGGPGPVETSS